MHVNESSENYLETILMLSKKLPVVRAVDIATELNFKKSSVSVAMKKLRESEHIIVSREGYITLTESGQTRFPIFSRINRSRFSVSYSSSARDTISASI